MVTTIPGNIEGGQNMNFREVMTKTWKQWSEVSKLLSKEMLPTVLPIRMIRLNHSQIAARFHFSDQEMEALRVNNAMVTVLPLPSGVWSVNISPMLVMDTQHEVTKGKIRYLSLVRLIQYRRTPQFKGLITDQEDALLTQSAQEIFDALPIGTKNELAVRGLSPDVALTQISEN